MTTALLDRLTHHCHIVETGNESYRVTQATANSSLFQRGMSLEPGARFQRGLSLGGA
jgi:hypothetical protein